jgi:hypothetical protein
MVPCFRNPPRLLAERGMFSICIRLELSLTFSLALWSELDVPMERPHSPVADPDSRYRFLHRSLGSDAVGSNAFQQNSYVASSRVCCWFRGSSLVPDAMGNIIFGTLHSLGWFARSLSRSVSMVVARRVRRRARRRVGYDPPPGMYLSLVADNPSLLNFLLRPCLAYMSAPH